MRDFLPGDTVERATPSGSAAQPTLSSRDKHLFIITGFVMILGIGLAIVWVSWTNANLQSHVARRNAVQWARQLSAVIDLNSVFETGVISREAGEVLRVATNVGNVYRYKIYDASGTIVAASDPGDVGKPAPSAHFPEVVTQGRVHVSVKTGDAVAHYAEAYVPVMDGGRFQGAVEVYMDMGAHEALNRKALGVAAGGLLLFLFLSAAIAGTITYRNIRERENAQRNATDAKDKAEVACRAKTEFLANMSHELRTPLNSIIGFSELLERDMTRPPADSGRLEYVRYIHEGGMQLLQIINDILDISKIEAGMQELREQDIEMSYVFQSCLRLMGQRARDAGVSLAVAASPDLPPIYADKRLVKQIVINLLSNAVKFTPHGGRIDVNAFRDDNGMLVISVADTGIGIPEADIPRIIEPFQQADGSASKRYGGIGLGLPLARTFTELHEGSLELHSTPGSGTTVTVRFPAERVGAKEAFMDRPAA